MRRIWYGYSAKMPAPKRASSPFCVQPAQFELDNGPFTVYCNGKLNHDGPHYSVGLIRDERVLLAEWDYK